MDARPCGPRGGGSRDMLRDGQLGLLLWRYGAPVFQGCIAVWEARWIRFRRSSLVTIFVRNDARMVRWFKRLVRHDWSGTVWRDYSTNLMPVTTSWSFTARIPKTYGYGKVCCKVKGFSLSSERQEQLNYEVMHNNVLAEVTTPPPQPRILPMWQIPLDRPGFACPRSLHSYPDQAIIYIFRQCLKAELRSFFLIVWQTNINARTRARAPVRP